LKPLNGGTRIFDGDLTERAGSSLSPDQSDVLSNGRDADSTDAPDTAGSAWCGGETSPADHQRR